MFVNLSNYLNASLFTWDIDWSNVSSVCIFSFSGLKHSLFFGTKINIFWFTLYCLCLIVYAWEVLKIEEIALRLSETRFIEMNKKVTCILGPNSFVQLLNSTSSIISILLIITIRTTFAQCSQYSCFDQLIDSSALLFCF